MRMVPRARLLIVLPRTAMRLSAVSGKEAFVVQVGRFPHPHGLERC